MDLVASIRLPAVTCADVRSKVERHPVPLNFVFKTFIIKTFVGQ